MRLLFKLMVLIYFPVLAYGDVRNKALEISTLSTVEYGRPIEINVPFVFLQAIDLLNSHAMAPAAGDKYLLTPVEFCECTLEKVLKESDNRETLFFKTRKLTAISKIMITVWRYKNDGADLDLSGAFNNVRVNDNKASFSVARNSVAKGAVLKISWAIGNELPGATLIEIMAKMDFYSDKNLKEASKILGRSANLIDASINIVK